MYQKCFVFLVSIRVNYMYEYIWGDFKLFLMDDIVFYIYIIYIFIH